MTTDRAKIVEILEALSDNAYVYGYEGQGETLQQALNLIEQDGQRIAELEAGIAKLREAMERIDDLLVGAMEADCENGVKWLNERAAQNYLREYPDTLKAINQTLEISRAIVEEAE